jgi:hypothetical protein
MGLGSSNNSKMPRLDDSLNRERAPMELDQYATREVFCEGREAQCRLEFCFCEAPATISIGRREGLQC